MTALPPVVPTAERQPQPPQFWFPTTLYPSGALPRATLDPAFANRIDALVASSNYLRNMQRLQSKVLMQTNALPPTAPVPVGNDERFRYGANLTRVRKSAGPAGEFDRLSSEWYPLGNPYIVTPTGQDSRWTRRGSEITGMM